MGGGGYLQQSLVFIMMNTYHEHTQITNTRTSHTATCRENSLVVRDIIITVHIVSCVQMCKPKRRATEACIVCAMPVLTRRVEKKNPSQCLPRRLLAPFSRP